jgi:nitroreductase
MSGIIFFKTQSLEIIHHFYHHTLEMDIWLEQSNCYIYKKGNLLLGFIGAETSETQGMITIFNQDKEVIDAAYKKYASLVTQDLRINNIFNIYHFYICDPEGRKIEFQTFLHPLKAYQTIEEGLITRRSIRRFKSEQVSLEVLNRIFELCRYSPTSRNTQSYYYLVITNKDDLIWLANTRGKAAKPISDAPMTVLVISDNTKTFRLEQDSDIAATYFMLAAHANSVATCWITDMNKAELKSYFDIPADHFVTCAIATGYPDEFKEIPYRREVNEFVKYGKF